MNHKWTASWFSSLAVVACLALPHGPVWAMFSDDEARRAIIDLRTRLETLNNRIADLERALQNSAQSQIQLLNENERMRSEIANLRGQMEEANLATRTGKTQQKDLYVDLDKRIEEQRNTIASLEGKLRQFEPATVQVNGVTYRVTHAEKARFEELQSVLAAGDFKKAIRLSQEFEKEHATSALLGDVVFAKGTALYADKDYRASIAARRDLIKRFPKHPTVPQAMLNMAASLAETGNPNTAKRTLEDLIKAHPNSAAATEARKRLK